MNRLILGGIAAVAFLHLAGCSGIAKTDVATFSADLSGEFDDNGTHSADIAFITDVNKGTFEGSIDNFKFSRRGFDSPSGSIPISGTVFYEEEGKRKFTGDGEGTLSQDGVKYKVRIHIESGFVHPRLNSVSMWYFGGGGFTSWGRWLEWVGFRGRFRAEVNCKQGKYGDTQCTLPALSPAKK